MATLTIQPWNKSKAEKELKKRLERAVRARSRFEKQWAKNERTLFSSTYEEASNDDIGVANVYDALRNGFGAIDGMQINYSFKYLRFIHAQMSANPPSVIPVPTSTEYKDRRAAKVADAFIQHGRRKLKLQEKVDLTSLQTLTYGTGFLKTFFDPFLGEAWEVDESTGDITMQGDITAKPILIHDMYIDPDATLEEEIGWMIERHVYSVEEAIARFPDKKEEIEALKGQYNPTQSSNKEDYEDLIEIFEYTEKAAPLNGMDGRRIFHLKTGKLLSDVMSNPYPDGRLPYRILTDVDVPGQVYGKTFIDYIIQLQDIINKIDSTVLDNIKNHGVARMVLSDGAEIADDDISNDSIDVLKVKNATQGSIHFIAPPTIMTDIYKMRQQIEVGMESLSGVNESMFGQVKREMSGFSLQTAINAGNMVRRRLFNKYQGFVEGVYTDFLELIQKHYSDSRKVLIAGEEEAISVAYFSGADISGGVDLKVDYGTSFSLDPASRREEIMQIKDVLKDAGYDSKKLLGLLRLNELNVAFDEMEVGKRRQYEIFDEIIAKYEETGTLIQIAPEANEEHASMLEACKEFRMSMTFKALAKELRDTIDAHYNARKAMLADQLTPAPAASAAPMLPNMPIAPAPAAPGTLPPILGK